MTEHGLVLTAMEESPCDCKWPDEAWDEPSVAVVIVDQSKRNMIWSWSGPHLEYWICEGVGEVQAAEDIGLGEPGVYIVEVKIHGGRNYWGEYDAELVVVSERPLDDEEWRLFQESDEGCLPDRKTDYFECKHCKERAGG